MERIRVMLADPQTLFREGMRALFARCDFAEVVSDPAGAVVLMEVAGTECLKIRSCSPDARVAFLTNRQDGAALLEYRESGAAGYILKDASFDELVGAVRTIHEGGTWVSAAIAEKMMGAGRESRQAALTGREREVLKMTAEGRSVKEVAVILDLSAKTVDAHKVNLMRKLRIHNKAQLVHYAFENRVLEL